MKRVTLDVRSRHRIGDMSFSEATDVTDFVYRRRKLRLELIAMRFLVLLLALSAICVAGYPYVMQRVSDYRLASANSALEERVAGWPYPRAEDALKAAEASVLAGQQTSFIAAQQLLDTYYNNLLVP